jgi:glyoxylase-like metal-dependent hydrolase (beta-lactamase superfamily II)
MAHLSPDPAAFVDTRRVGDATITVVSEGALKWPPRFLIPEEELRRVLPDVDAQGRVWLGLNDIIIRLGGTVIVVDPGMDDPDSRWQRDRARVWPNWPVTRSPGLAAAMADLTIEPEDVTHVLITHPHVDHYPGVAVERGDDLVARFPNARHFIGRADWEGNPGRKDPDSDLVRLELVDRMGLLDLVDADREIVPGVTMHAAPGESPGHCIVRVESAEETFYALGDLVHLAVEVEQPTWGPPHVDLNAMTTSRRRWFPQIAADAALVVSAHAPFPPWGRIVADGIGFRWERG